MQDLERQWYLDRMAKDYFNGMEAVPDQTGSGGVLTFNFQAPVQLVFVRVEGMDQVVGRATVNNQSPSASLGVYCGNGEATPIPAQTSSVKVFAPSGAWVYVWGFRY